MTGGVPEQPTDPCPECGSAGVEIVYGLASPLLAEEAGRSGFVLGGCCVFPWSPDRRCPACGHEWQTPEFAANPFGTPDPVDDDTEPLPGPAD